MKKYFVLYSIVLSVCVSAHAQKMTANALDGSLEERFDYVYKKSSSYENYKVVSIANFNHLKKSTLDSINFYKKEIDASKNKIQDITANVESLTQELQSAKTEITQLKNSLKTTTFLGVTMNKGLYNMVMVGIISGLLLLLVMFIMKFRSAKTQAGVAVENLSRIEEEYADYKRKAMEKEQQLGRKLQDEINKNKKINNN